MDKLTSNTHNNSLSQSHQSPSSEHLAKENSAHSGTTIDSAEGTNTRQSKAPLPKPRPSREWASNSHSNRVPPRRPILKKRLSVSNSLDENAAGESDMDSLKPSMSVTVMQTNKR